MENIPILEGISPDEVEQMRVCFGVREERFRADTVIYDISEGRGELGLLTAGSAVIQRIEGRYNQADCRFAILPTILTAVSAERLHEAAAVLRKEENADEEAEENTAD